MDDVSLSTIAEISKVGAGGILMWIANRIVFVVREHLRQRTEIHAAAVAGIASVTRSIDNLARALSPSGADTAPIDITTRRVGGGGD